MPGVNRLSSKHLLRMEDEMAMVYFLAFPYLLQLPLDREEAMSLLCFVLETLSTYHSAILRAIVL